MNTSTRHPTPDPLALWRAGAAWRVDALPGAVDRRNTAPRKGLLRGAKRLAGPLALLTIKAPQGTPSTYATASRLLPALLTSAGLPAETVYAAHLGHTPHAHALTPVADLPARCPVCRGAWQPVQRVTRQGEVVAGHACPSGCAHWRPVTDLRAAVAYLAGPADPLAWQGPQRAEQAARKRLREGRHVMRGTLRRAPRYRGPALAALLRAARLAALLARARAALSRLTTACRVPHPTLPPHPVTLAPLWACCGHVPRPADRARRRKEAGR